MRVVCRNPECGDSLERNRDAPQLKMVRETDVAWVFVCVRCQKEGRNSPRVVTKNAVGGTVGAGHHSDGIGSMAGKGPTKYRPLGGFFS